MPRAKRDAQHADVKLFTILERVDPKTVAVEELLALPAVPRLASPRWYLGYVLTATETNAVCGHDRRTRLGTDRLGRVPPTEAQAHPPFRTRDRPKAGPQNPGCMKLVMVRSTGTV